MYFIHSHGPSARQRKAQTTGRMNMLFDLWDVSGDGIIDTDEMKKITEAYVNKFSLVFGDKAGWKRVDNLGFVTQSTFKQFFQWFILEPTMNAFVSKVEHGDSDDKVDASAAGKYRYARENTPVVNSNESSKVEDKSEDTSESKTTPAMSSSSSTKASLSSNSLKKRSSWKAVQENLGTRTSALNASGFRLFAPKKQAHAVNLKSLKQARRTRRRATVLRRKKFLKNGGLGSLKSKGFGLGSLQEDEPDETLLNVKFEQHDSSSEEED
jgi:hypothetical protein